ncbi:MAG: hypothetical protein ABI977_25945 [Acidobacteriota bacterium]
MSTTQVQTQLTFEQLVDAVKQLPRNKQKELASQINLWQSQPARVPKRKTNGKQALTEDELLARITSKSRLPEKDQRRLNRLRRKLQDETITESELLELQTRWQQVEQMSVERLRDLVELSQRRGMDLDTLMRELKLWKPRHVF